MSKSVLPRALLVWIAAACAANVMWIHVNAAPPRSWDDAEYLADSVITYRALERGDFIDFVRLASRPARGVHPPMTKLVPIPMYLVFGPGTRPALYAYTTLIPIFCVYVFLLARLVSRNTTTAVLAVVVTSSFPLTYGLWRLVMAEFGLAVAVIAAQYHLLRCAQSRAREVSHAVLAGIFIGCGMLWKISFPVFVVAPLCYLIVLTVGAKESRRAGVVALSLSAVAALAVAGPFYFLRLPALWDFVVYNSTPSASLQPYSLGSVFSAVTVLKYWAALANTGISAYWAVTGAALAIVQLLRRRWPLPVPETWFLLSCAVIPLVFFSFQYLKEPRHLFPAFPMLGVIVAALLWDNIAHQSKRVRSAALGVALAFPMYQFVYLSFDVPGIRTADVRLGPLVFLVADRDAQFVRPANPTAWPVADVVGHIAAHSAAITEHDPRVRIVGHIPFIDGPSLSYESVLRYRRPLTYSIPRDPSLHPTWWDFVVVLMGPVKNPAEYREPLLADLLSAERLPFTHLTTIRLPEGREAKVYRASSGVRAAEANGADLITAVDNQGKAVYPTSSAAWNVAGKRRTVAVSPGGMPIEFAYAYVSDAATLLSWEVMREPGTTCGTASYEVTVFDMSFTHGPRQNIARAFTLPADRGFQSEGLPIEAFRGQIVTIKLSPLLPRGISYSCLGWHDLKIVDARSGPTDVSPDQRPQQ